MKIGYTISSRKKVWVENDRPFSGTLVIGQSQTGKTILLNRSVLDDIHDGRGVAYIGERAADVLDRIPSKRREDVILIDPADKAFSISINPFSADADKQLISDTIVSGLKSLWDVDITAPIMSLYLGMPTRSLLDQKNRSILSIPDMLLDEELRDEVIHDIEHTRLRHFWLDYFEALPKKDRHQDIKSAITKIFPLATDPALAALLDKKSKVDFKDIMDNGKILIFPLPQRHFHPEKLSFIGSLILAQLLLAARTRSRPIPFPIYIDNVHRFAAKTVAELIEYAPALSLSVVVAHHHLDELRPEVRRAVLGLVGTVVAFRVGVADAETLAQQFRIDTGPNTTNTPLTELPDFTAHASVSGVLWPGLTMPRPDHPLRPSSPQKIRDISRDRYA